MKEMLFDYLIVIVAEKFANIKKSGPKPAAVCLCVWGGGGG